jgi:hypothetical protein
LFTHQADANNTGTGETDLYSDTIAGGQLATNGNQITATYAGLYAGSATASATIKFYFGGTALLTTGALAVVSASSWTITAAVIRVSASVVRYTVQLASPALSTQVYEAVGELTGLDLTAGQIIKITGQMSGTGADSNQITAKLGVVEFGQNASAGSVGPTGATGATGSSGSSGALVLLEQHTASSSATLDFTTAISSTYDEYVIEMLQVVPATDSNICLLRFSTDGGSTWISGTSYVDHVFVGGAGIAVMGATAGSSIRVSWGSGSFLSNLTGVGQSGTLRLSLAQTGTSYPSVVGMMSGQLTDGYAVWLTGGNYHVAGAAVNAFRFLMASGNIASGTIRVYGIAKS